METTGLLNGSYYHCKSQFGRTYFDFLASNGNFVEAERKKRTKVFCKLCNTDLSYKGNTTNMISHLSYHHKNKYAVVKKQLESKQSIQTDKSAPSMAVTHSSQSLSQRTIVNSFELVTPYSRSSLK